MIEHRINDGIYQRLGRRAVGLFAATPGLPAIEVAAILNNPTAVLSHFSAARRHQLVMPDDGLAHIVVPVEGRSAHGARPRSTERLKVHKARQLDDNDVTTRGGLAVTSIERTIIDLFEVLKRRDDRRTLIAEAFRKRRTTAGRMSAAILRISQLNRRAELIYTIELAAGGSHSAGEMRLYEFMAAWDLPEPNRQTIPQLPKGRRYLDCALPTSGPTSASGRRRWEWSRRQSRPGCRVRRRLPAGRSTAMIDDVTPIAELAQRRKLTVAVAESLTGGLLANRFARSERASEWFAGGVVAYTSEAKVRSLLCTPGPVVTERTAREMAEGVAKLLDADVTVSTTGVGGPDPEERNPPGTVWIGVYADGAATAHLLHLDGGPGQVVEGACAAAVRLLAARLGVAGG